MTETQQDYGRKRLPIGIQDFQVLREDDCYYVDKTQLIYQLITEGRHYFLSRPRRFGKSLLLDTIGQLFAGNEELFRGLAIHDQWHWSNRHPVVRPTYVTQIRLDKYDLMPYITPCVCSESNLQSAVV